MTKARRIVKTEGKGASPSEKALSTKRHDEIKKDLVAAAKKIIAKPERLTYTGRVLRRNGRITETAMLDVAVAMAVETLVADPEVKAIHLNQVVEVVKAEFDAEVNTARLRDHLNKVPFFRDNVNIDSDGNIKPSKAFKKMVSHK